MLIEMCAVSRVLQAKCTQSVEAKAKQSHVFLSN
jgi:hypothetical protein